MLRKTEFFKAVDTAGQILQKDFPDKKYSADFIRNLGRKYTLPMEQGDISDLVARAIITAAYQRTEAVEVLVNFETAWEAYQSRMGIRNAA